jgi:hypothetical protein
LLPIDDGFEIELTGAIAQMVALSLDQTNTIELTGAIAQMVALSLDQTNTKKAAFDEKTACSVKVVAGARKQRESLILPVRL